MKNSSIKESFGEVLKICMTEVFSDLSIDALMDSSPLVDLALEKAQSEKKNIKNFKINQQKIEINPKREEHFSQRKQVAKKRIGEFLIKKIIDEIPEKQNPFLLGDLGIIGEKLKEFSELREELKIKTPFGAISFDNWEILNDEDGPRINCFCRLAFLEDAKQPVAKILMNPSIGQNPFMRIQFQIFGEIYIPFMQFKNVKSLDVLIKEFDATLGVALYNIDFKGSRLGLREEREEAMFTIAEKIFNHKFR